MAIDAYFKGIAFPFAKGPNSLPKPATDDDVVKQSIIRILLTSRGERVNRSDFGSNFLSMIFEPLDDTLMEMLRVEVSSVINKFEPRALVTDLRVSQNDTTIIVDLGYAVIATRAQQTIQMTFPRWGA